MFLGHLAYLDAKARGDNRMPGKRWSPGGVQGEVPRDPRDMAKAGLLEVQSPKRRKAVTPVGTTPVTDAAPCPGIEIRLGQPLWRGAPPNEGGQGDEWAAYVVLDTYSEDVPRDHLQGASPTVTECP